ncbi:MAG: NAD-dependent epimerase/dehydratase family protein [Eubacteriales bacterium]|nr:NAD-dependent epimerase/dehydratase family protein [Eubacteriales bacterium]
MEKDSKAKEILISLSEEIIETNKKNYSSNVSKPQNNRKILIAGAGGFIGRNLCEELRQYGYYLRTIFRTKESSLRIPDNERENMEILIGDVSDEEFCRIAVEGVDAVINLAAEISGDNQKMFRSNVVGFFNLANMACKHKVKKFIYASSSIVYGNGNESYQKETDKLHLYNFYSVTKYINEILSDYFHEQTETEFCGCRLFNVYGNPNIESWDVISKYFKAAISDKPIVVDNPNAYRDYVYVKDVAKAIRQIIETESNMDSKIVNIGTGCPTKLVELAKMIKTVCDSDSEIVIRNKSIRIVNSCADIGLLSSIIDFRFSIIEDNLKSMYERYRKDWEKI